MTQPRIKPITSGKRKKPAASQDYPEGHFTRTMRAGFPPGFVSQISALRTRQEAVAAERSIETATPNGWQKTGGTVVMPRTPSHPRPEWMKQAEPSE